MEGLIQFYSKSNLKDQIDLYDYKISEYNFQKKITIETKEYELERFASIVKRYLRIGENSLEIEKLVA